MSADFAGIFAKVGITILTAISAILGTLGLEPLIKKACEEPIEYSIGSFDRRFNISNTDFLSAIKLAEAVWEKPLGLELFNYNSESGELVVNLIYDYRQEVTSTLSDIEEEVEEEEREYNTLRSMYLASKSEYERLKVAYDSSVRAFDQRNEAYSRMVDDWNKSSRTNKSQFEALERERRALEIEANNLKRLEAELNSKVREVNNQVGELNSLAKDLNISAETYNTIGATRGDTFTGGLYHSDGRNQTIDIFEFDKREKLVRTLAHELGHALGLEHLDDEKAIMHHLNEGGSNTASTADIEALKILCEQDK